MQDFVQPKINNKTPVLAPSSTQYRNWQLDLDHNLKTQNGALLDRPVINRTSKNMIENKRNNQPDDNFTRAPVHERLY